MLTIRALSLDGNAESKDSEPINLLKYVIQPHASHLIQDTKKVSLQHLQSQLQSQLPVQVPSPHTQPHTQQQQQPQAHQQSLQQQIPQSNQIVKVPILQQQSINASSNNSNSSQGISTNIIEEKVFLNIYLI